MKSTFGLIFAVQPSLKGPSEWKNGWNLPTVKTWEEQQENNLARDLTRKSGLHCSSTLNHVPLYLAGCVCNIPLPSFVIIIILPLYTLSTMFQTTLQQKQVDFSQSLVIPEDLGLTQSTISMFVQDLVLPCVCNPLLNPTILTWHYCKYCSIMTDLRRNQSRKGRRQTRRQKPTTIVNFLNMLKICPYFGTLPMKLSSQILFWTSRYEYTTCIRIHH